MTSTHKAALIDHSPSCPRPAVVLRLSWLNLPELACGNCGRYAAVPVDGEQTTPAPHHTPAAITEDK